LSEAPQPQKVLVNVKITLDDEGKLSFEYNGSPAPDYLVSKAKREHGDEIRQMIADCCEKVNGRAKALAQIHIQTPPPTARVHFMARSFDKPQPLPPIKQPHGILGWVFKNRASAIDVQNNLAQDKYKKDLGDWNAQKEAFATEEAERKEFLEHRILTDPSAMETHFENALGDITWPRETHVSFELLDQGKSIVIDVDLPEVDQMPKTSWSLPAHSFRPTIKHVTENQVLKLYAEHTQGVGFRIIGEAFAVLPSLEKVTISGYTQRANPATGVMQDEYVYSVRATRDAWSRINFNNLAALDVSEALAQFELRRNMTKNGGLQAIEPFATFDHKDADVTTNNDASVTP
jgi:hypothetical protein